MKSTITKTLVRAIAGLAIAAGITVGATGFASARQIIIIEDGTGCYPVCQTGPHSYTDWYNC